VEGVGSRLHGVVEITTRRLTKLCGVVAGLNRDFLNGVQARLTGLLVDLPDVAGGVLAFDTDRLAVRRHAVHDDALAKSLRAAEGVRGARKQDDLLQRLLKFRLFHFHRRHHNLNYKCQNKHRYTISMLLRCLLL